MSKAKSPEAQLREDIGGFTHDPYGFVMYAFPWGQTGTELEKFPDGPDEWQTDILKRVSKGLLDINQAIRIAVASGNGIGKSALVAFLVLWSISTFPHTKGVVTANTKTQLETKTWPEVAKWFNLLICKHWFDFNATSIKAKGSDGNTWRVDYVPWSANNPEAFAGLHNLGKRILLLFDEGSAIDDIIWEYAEGALTDRDTEIIWCVFGNPTRATGRFRECFSKFKARWSTRQIDSRTVERSNKRQIQEWLEDWGEEHDFFKVRVKGEFPLVDEDALFTEAEIDRAMAKTYTERDINGFPRVAGLDVARSEHSSSDSTVMVIRQGPQMFTPKVIRIPDSMLISGIVAQTMDKESVDTIYVDGTGGYGWGVVSDLRSLGRSPISVEFNGKPMNPMYHNKRSEMYFELSKWIKAGGALPNRAGLKEELLATTYRYYGDKFAICPKDDIKEKIGRSPDEADACALTLAFPTAPRPVPGTQKMVGHCKTEYDPFANMGNPFRNS